MTSYPRRKILRRSHRAGARGFTLVELLVSLTGALLISISVFSLAKYTTSLYQEESHIANANLASVVGFERLRADLARAGYMSSPHVLRDPFVCGTPLTDGTWPARLKTMSSIRIEDIAASQLPSVYAANGVTPQQIILAGNYTSAEAFPIRSVVPAGDDYEVYLQVQTGPMARLGYHIPDVDQKALLESVFPTGRAVRIRDKSGRDHYGTISSVSGGDQPIVVLKGDAPTLHFRDQSAIGCGLKGEETGALINTVNFIRYTLRSLSGDARYAPLYAGPGPAYDADRVELVRDELAPDGSPIAGSAELVAEYAVDLRFRLTVAPSARDSLLYVANDDVLDWAGPAETLSIGRGPQLVRTVHAWLSVRSRSADRTGTIDVEEGPPYRFGVGTSGGAPFARVRTVQARVALTNQLGTTWQ